MFQKRFNLRNVATIVACLAVCAVMSCGKNKDKDGDDGGNGAAAGGADITLSLKAGTKANEVIVTCSPAFSKTYIESIGTPFRFIKTENPTDSYFNFTGSGDGDPFFYLYESEFNAAGTEFTCVFETIGGSWTGTVTLKPITAIYDGSFFGVKSLKIGTNNPVSVSIIK